MSHYDRERDYPRDMDRDRKGYDRSRGSYYPHDHHSDRMRNSGLSRTQSQGPPPISRDYPPPRSRDPPLPPPPPRRENISVPEFKREMLQNQKDQVLLATVPFDEKDTNNHPLCALLRKSAENQKRIIKSIEQLARVLGEAGDFVAGCSEVTSAAKKAELIRSDLDGRYQFLSNLSQGNLTSSVQNFFSLPDNA